MLLALPAPGTCLAQNFQWNWHEARALARENSLRSASLTERERQALAVAVIDQIRPYAVDAGLSSDEELQKSALDTTIAKIQLNGEGSSEIVAQGTVACSPTGNCPIWIFQKAPHGYKLILNGFGQTFTLQHSRTNGYLDIVTGMHGSATEVGLTVYRSRNGRYRESGCYVADWQVVEGEEIRLKEPRIIRCER